ncbi:ABC transporter ATP-binding protein [Salinicola avicenniae]|uniref:ABC transporter ATP-binding protein n=1 Tax=Salinicola avicenniae TaxID=2916836 RepID=UPI00207424AB|nr:MULTISPECIES: oligopeptide/dipeptide ABC transporter ATP-binding protein [unclassified Salinicola]
MDNLLDSGYPPLAQVGRPAGDDIPLLRVRQLQKRYALRGARSWTGRQPTRSLEAVDGVDLDIQRGDVCCIVGESGCGKSTLARLIMGLTRPSHGEVHYDGKRIDHLGTAQRRPYRRRMQMIFQDPYASLNPRLSVRSMLEEPLRVYHRDWTRGRIREAVEALMADLGMSPEWGSRHAHEFSGGQRQRIAIARALILNPEFVVADEPVSSLDVSVQAQVLNLLAEIQTKRQLTFVMITHDLAVVEHFATRVAVMYRGTLCEISDPATLFSSPRHPYTHALLAAMPRIDDDRNCRPLPEAGVAASSMPGCAFSDRCPYATTRCRREAPALVELDNAADRWVACHGVEEKRL